MTTMTSPSGTKTSPSAPGMREVDAAQVKAWLDAGQACVFDVRELDERARESIPGTLAAPLSRFNASTLPTSGRLVFHCKSGTRSREAAARALAGGRSDVFFLKGGIEGWKASGLPVAKGIKVPISIMRQVQIVVGTMVLACSVLAFTVSPYFIGGAAFFGAGLIFAGTTGMCGMAAVLGLMPWNKSLRACGDSCSGC